MKTSEFCYWLQGYFELSNTNELSKSQVDIIKNHLNLVFVHDLDPKQVKDKLQQIHDAKIQPPNTSEDVIFRC